MCMQGKNLRKLIALDLFLKYEFTVIVMILNLTSTQLLSCDFTAVKTSEKYST